VGQTALIGLLLMGDEIAGEQFVLGGDQGWQVHSHHGGYGGVAVRRQAVLVGHGTEGEVQQHGVAGEMRGVLAHEAAVDPGPAGLGGRRSRAGTRMGVAGMRELRRGKTTGSSKHIPCGDRSPGAVGAL
jgi:hypothetical protein